jgi:predicted permease
MALLSVGFRLERVPALGAPLAVGLGTKLVLAPLALGALYTLVGVPLQLPLQTTLLEASMPPMITAGILAADRGLEPPLARAMVGLGTPLGAATAVLWSLLLTW